MAFGAGVFGGNPFGGLLPSGSTTNRRRRVLMGSGDTMLAVRQSTAFETAIGPVLDASGVAVTDCVVGDFKIKKTSGNFAALNASATLTHVSAGFYDLVLTTSDVDTVGVNVVAIDDTTNTCSPLYMQVIEEAVYDAVFAASAAGYQVPIWAAANSTVNLSATTIKTATDVETDTADIQTRLPAALVSGRIDASVGAMAANTITAAATAADYITEVQTAITGGAYDLDTDANGRIRIVDGTGTGEINTTSGVVEARLANDVSHGGNNAQIWLQSTGIISPLTIKCNNFGSGIGPAISLDVDTGECIRLYGGSALTTGVVFEVGSKAVSCTSTGVTSDVQGAWNAAWDAEVQSECADALTAYGASTLTAAGIRTAVGLASANLDTQLDALPTAAENAAALMDLSNGVETGVTPRQALRLIAAALAGELSGAATTTVTIKAANNNGTTRITATVDADGNRTALTLNP